MRIVRHPDARRFLDRAGPWLLREEAAHALPLGIAERLARQAPYRSLYLATVEDDEGGDEPLGCAVLPPSGRLTLTGLPPAAAERLALDIVDCVAPEDLVGLSGPAPSAQHVAAALARISHRRWALRARLRGYTLTAATAPHCQDTSVAAPASVSVSVSAPASVSASMPLRLARAADLALVDVWAAAFVEETDAPFSARRFGARLIPERRLYLWDDGEPRAMAAVVRETLHGASIGCVYTPPAQRRQGIASALVAALSRKLLDSGRHFCSLYADLANPTANTVYRQIGYCAEADLVVIDLIDAPRELYRQRRPGLVNGDCLK